MAETKFLNFKGLHASIALSEAAPLEALAAEILSGWPHHYSTTPPETPPFVSISPKGDRHWSLQAGGDAGEVRNWDAVNTICDMVAEMAWERLRSAPELLCLHAAAADFGGRLVVFPNARRAGKSTLAVALAHRGHRLFTDDFLPVRVNADDRAILGVANGIAPRLRLPVPDSFSDEFRDWLASEAGPANRQYKYLTDAPISPYGATLPLGAMVVLDRQDDPVKPSLELMAREDALTSLIKQNFARSLNAGIILKSFDAITRHLPLYRLTYHCGEEAAEFLSDHPELNTLPAAIMEDAALDMRQAPLDQLGKAVPAFQTGRKYIQTPGLIETEAGGEHFLADGTGLAIYRLNSGSASIWRLLADPTDLEELVTVFTAAFPDTPSEQIGKDCEQLMHSFVQAQLVTPADSGLRTQ